MPQTWRGRTMTSTLQRKKKKEKSRVSNSEVSSPTQNPDKNILFSWTSMFWCLFFFFFNFREAQMWKGADFLVWVLYCLNITFKLSQDDTMFNMENVEFIAVLNFCAKKLGVYLSFRWYPHLQRYPNTFLRQTPKPMKDIFETPVSVYINLV